MNYNAIKLNWEPFSDDQHNFIIAELLQNKNYATASYAEVDSNFFYRIPLDDSDKRNFINLKDWPNKYNFCKKLFPNFTEESMSLLLRSLELQEAKKCLLPHYDVDRKFSLFYLIDGANAETQFYEPKEVEEKNKIYNGKYYYMHQVNVIESHNFKNKNWYIFNNSAIHGVLLFKGIRYSLVLDISDPIFNIKNYDELVSEISVIKEKLRINI